MWYNRLSRSRKRVVRYEVCTESAFAVLGTLELHRVLYVRRVGLVQCTEYGVVITQMTDYSTNFSLEKFGFEHFDARPGVNGR